MSRINIFSAERHFDVIMTLSLRHVSVIMSLLRRNDVAT